jgi:hypothetical protein
LPACGSLWQCCRCKPADLPGAIPVALPELIRALRPTFAAAEWLTRGYFELCRIYQYADLELAKLLNTVASLQDISMSQLINDAIEIYLQQDKVQALIKKHSLDQINDEDDE